MPPGVARFPFDPRTWDDNDFLNQLYKLTTLAYNVRDYGAVGDGVADDRPAIQAAIDECSKASTARGGLVFFPPGTYKVGGAIIAYDTKLTGTARGAARIVLANGVNADVIQTPDDGVQRYWLDISNLQIDGNAANQSGTSNCINLRGMNECRISNCRIVNPKTNGIRIGQATGGMFCTVPMIVHNLIRGDVANPPTGNGVDADSGSSDCIIAENDIGYFANGAGVLLSGHNGGEVIGNQCWQNKHGYQLFQANRMRLVGNLSDLAKVYGFVIQESSDVQLIGCQARESSQNGLNGADGIFIEGPVGGPPATDILIAGCRSMGSLQRYGLVLNQQLNRVKVLGFNGYGNQTGHILLGATALTNVSARERLGSVEAITYSASMTPDAAAGGYFTIVANNATAFTINNPTNAVKGYELTLDIKNTSGGALGAITFGAAFLLAGAFVAPATTKRRTISFVFDGTNWIETNRAAADI